MCLRVAQNFVLCSFELGEAERTNERGGETVSVEISDDFFANQLPAEVEDR